MPFKFKIGFLKRPKESYYFEFVDPSGCERFVLKGSSFSLICNSAEEIEEQVHEPMGEWVEPNGEGERAQITRLPGLSYTV